MGDNEDIASDRGSPLIDPLSEDHASVVSDAEDALFHSAGSTDAAIEASKHVKRFAKTPAQIIAALETRVDHLTNELGEVIALLAQLKAAMPT